MPWASESEAPLLSGMGLVGKGAASLLLYWRKRSVIYILNFHLAILLMGIVFKLLCQTIFSQLSFWLQTELFCVCGLIPQSAVFKSYCTDAFSASRKPWKQVSSHARGLERFESQL